MKHQTLGGQRLGSGKKMDVELSGFERSTHDLSYIWRSSMSAGTLVPFLNKVMLPGDTWDVYLDCDIRTIPTIGPLFGSMKVQLDVFTTPMRLYNSLLHNNALEIGLSMAKALIPQIELTAIANMNPLIIQDLDNCQINPSSIMAYLGVRGVGFNNGETEVTRLFNAIPLMIYWDIYKNYYSNKQEKIGAVIHTNAITPSAQTITTVKYNGSITIAEKPALTTSLVPIQAGGSIVITYSGTRPDYKQIYINLDDGRMISIYDLATGAIVAISGTLDSAFINTTRWGTGAVIINWNYMGTNTPIVAEPTIQTFDLKNIDTCRKKILAYEDEAVPFVLNTELGESLPPYSYVWQRPNDIANLLSSQEGLGLKTYQSDLFNNWLDTEYITNINLASAVSTVGNTFTIDQLNLAEKIYKMLNRIAVSGGTYHDWIEAQYDIEKPKIAESPVYVGGMAVELIFQELISNSESGNQPLGTPAARGRLSDKKKGGNVYAKVNEPSYITGIVSITGRVDYSQGNEWDTHLLSYNDLHVPSLDQIGFQDLVTEQMAWWDTYYDTMEEEWVQKSAGKQPAWLNYMTSVNRTLGNFAIPDNQMWMTLNRRYESEDVQGIKDLTTYIDPTKFNWIFSQTSLDAQNFWVQIGIGITARRKMSAKIMPNL